MTYIHRVGRTGRYTDEGIALTFVKDKIFGKLAEKEQKIEIKEMISEKQIVDEMLVCSKKNDELSKEGKLRWEEE